MIENSVMAAPVKSETQILEEAITEALIEEHEAQIVAEVVEMAAASIEKAVVTKVPVNSEKAIKQAKRIEKRAARTVAKMIEQNEKAMVPAQKMLRLGEPITRNLLKIKDGPLKAWPIEQEHAYPDGHRTQRFVTTTCHYIRVTVSKKDLSPQKVYWAIEVD